MSDSRISTLPFPPAEFVCDAIHNRDWTIRQFANAAQIEVELAIRILSGQAYIGRGVAIPLARAFAGTSVGFWESLQRSYDLALQCKSEDAQ